MEKNKQTDYEIARLNFHIAAEELAEAHALVDGDRTIRARLELARAARRFVATEQALSDYKGDSMVDTLTGPAGDALISLAAEAFGVSRELLLKGLSLIHI